MEVDRHPAMIKVKRADGSTVTEKCIVIVHDDGQEMLQFLTAFTPAAGDDWSVTLDSE